MFESCFIADSAKQDFEDDKSKKFFTRNQRCIPFFALVRKPGVCSGCGSFIAISYGAFLCPTPREERVLRMRFGIGMNSDHTLEEVGQQFSVTRERIRQIEAKALRKLKHPTRARKLKTFLDE